jgi:hypothetical protein
MRLTPAGKLPASHVCAALNTADLNGKQITISAKLTQDSGSALNATITVFRPTTTANDFSAQTLLATSSAVSVPSSSGSGTAITHTFTLGSTDASKGLAVYVTYAGVGAVTSKSFYIGDLQLEVGPVATPFEQRPIGMELALCQRYFFAGRLFVPTSPSTQNVPLPVTMRTTMATATITGGGAGFALGDVTSNSVLIATQTGGSGQNLNVSTEL